MNNLIKIFLPNFLLLFLKRQYYLKKYKSSQLMIMNGCNIIDVQFGKGVYLGENVNVRNSFIDDFSYVNSNSSIQNTKIGKFTSIGPNVRIVLGNHPVNFVSTHPKFYANNKPFDTYADKMYFNEYGSVKIGNDVWIGQDVIIPGNIEIGDGAIITSKAVVTKNIEPYEIVGGVPAKHIKYRFSKEIILMLKKDKWWDKESNWLKDNFKKFHSINDYIKGIEE